MKIKSTGKLRIRRAAVRKFLRWLCLSAVLLLFYIFEVNPLVRGYCPLLLISLATAVAMYEGDLAAGVFGVFCGLMTDIASGVTVAGFSALLLLCVCPFVSLMTRFVIKRTFISYFIMNLCACVVIAGLDFVFLHWVWEGAQSGISFRAVILPAYGGAVFWSIPIYALVTFINSKFTPKQRNRLDESAQNVQDAEEREESGG